LRRSPRNRFVEPHRDSIRLGYAGFDRILGNGWRQARQSPGAGTAFLQQRRQARARNRASVAALAADYPDWVQQLAADQGLDLLEPPKGTRREDWVAPSYQHLGDRDGLAVLRKATAPERIAVSYARRGHALDLARRWVQVYYFYLRDQHLGRLCLRLCPYFPFHIPAWRNGHEWLARQLRRAGIAFVQRDHRFSDGADPGRLPALADAFGPQDVLTPVQDWLARRLPFLSAAERAAGYRHRRFLAPVEYCHNLVFQQRAAGDRLCDRLLDRNRSFGRPDPLAVIFGRPRLQHNPGTGAPVVKGTRLRTPVRSSGFPKTFRKQYVKEGTPLRPESTCYPLKDLSLPKDVHNLAKGRATLGASNERSLQVPQDVLQSYVARGPRQQLRQPTGSPSGRRTPGLRLGDRRLRALLQALVGLVPLGGQGVFRTGPLPGEVQQALGGTGYRLSQLRYDLGQLRGQGLVVRLPHRQRYRVPSAGYRLAYLYLKRYQRRYAPLTAALQEPFAGDARVRDRCRAKADRLYGAVDRALSKLAEHFGITPQAQPA
jgi:hypothetical protein